MYNNSDIIDYLKDNEKLKYYFKLKSFSFFGDTIIITLIKYTQNGSMIKSEFVSKQTFEKYLLKKRIDKINKIKERINDNTGTISKIY